MSDVAPDHPELANKLLSAEKYRNYASMECAKVIETNPEAKKTSHIINDQIDDYMLNPCKTKIWFVIELCDSIQATKIEIGSYELYSSTPKDFTVYFSDVYPAIDWKPIGHFTASNSRTSQTFDLNLVGFGKYIRVELHSHYGNEHYCVISEVKVYGDSMVDEYKKYDTGESGQIVYNNTKKISRKLKRKTSAYRVYRNMMIEPRICGLSQSLDKNDFRNETTQQIFHQLTEQPVKPILPLPTQQPVVINRTTPLKPSIFVELSNKVKALETSLKTQIEEMEKKLNESERKTEVKVDKLKLEFKSFALIMIAYYVYKLMLDLM